MSSSRKIPQVVSARSLIHRLPRDGEKKKPLEVVPSTIKPYTKEDYDKLKTFRVINLRGKKLQHFDIDGLILVIKESAVLERLVLNGSNNKLTIVFDYGKFANAFAKNKTLEYLSLRNNNISDEGIKYLADVMAVSKTLKYFDLYMNYVSNKGAKCLADALKVNKTLVKLDMRDNRIGSKGVKYFADALKENKSLEKLLLSNNNNIGDEGAMYLAGMITVNETLQWIDLDNIHIGNKGAESIAASLLVNSGIRTINLKCNNIGSKGAEKLSEAYVNNHNINTLNLSGNEMISASVMYQIDNILNDRVARIIAKKDMEIASRDEEIASLKRQRTDSQIKTLTLQLNQDHTSCSICLSKYSTDINSKDECITKHLPVISASSKSCDHCFCHGCVLKQQAAIAEGNDGKIPKWIPCMLCRTKTAFCPSEPKYNRMLIDILKEAKWVDAPTVKEEPIN